MKVIKTNQLPQSEIVTAAVACLKSGGLLLFPTETTYGAGVDATNPEAVQKLLSYKSKREGKPLSIAVTDKQMAEQYVDINESADKLYQRFLPGPVTIVSEVKAEAKTDGDATTRKLAPDVASEFGTLGVRIPDYDLVLKIVKTLGKPITATSANASGKKRPYTIDDILKNLSQKQKELIDLVIDAGELPKNKPSTVIDTTLSTPVTLRQGKPQIAESGQVLISKSETETKKIAGTLLLKHWNQIKEKGLVIGLDGPLGAGKTIFTKGVAEFLQISETVTSPTYSYLEEYDFVRHGFSGKLYHLDLWKVDSKELFERLAFQKLIQPGSVVVAEWWENVAAFAKFLPDIQIQISEEENRTRKLTINET